MIVITRKVGLTAAVMLTVGIFAGVSNAGVLLSESFISGERLTQNLPNTAAWYSAYASSGISDSSGDLVSLNNRHTLAYFTDPGAAQELAVGDTLTVDFSFSLDTPALSHTGFRVGLFDSGGDRISADNGGSSAEVFSNYTGYASFFNLQASSAMRVEERNSGLSSKLIHAGDSFTDHTGSQGAGTTFVSGQVYAGTLILQRLSSGVRIQCSVDGEADYGVEYIDSTDLKTAFDTFVIYASSSAVVGYTLTAVDVTYTESTGDLLLSETFVPGDRLTNSLPETAAWYTAYASTGISDSTGDLVSANNRHTLAYFTGSGSPQLLNVGDSIAVNFTFLLDTPLTITTGFRVGLFNSGGTRISGDNAGASATEFLDYSGYAAFFNLQAATAMRLEERSSGIGSKLIHSGDSYTDHTGDVGTGTTFVSDQVYSAVLSLLRTESGVQISASVEGETGYSALYEDTTGSIETAFDTFVIFASSTAVSGYTLKRVDVAYSPVTGGAAPGAAILTLTVGEGTVIIGSTNLTLAAQNQLQSKVGLNDIAWDDIGGPVTGVSETNWVVTASNTAAFYRVESSN